MYIILFSNSIVDNHLNYIHRGQNAKSMAQLINYKVIPKQGGFITLHPIKKALGSGVSKIPLNQNPFYKSLVLARHKGEFISNRFRDLFRCLSYNLLIVKDSTQLMRLLLDDKLSKPSVNSKNNEYYMKRIFEVKDTEKFLKLATTFDETYEAMLHGYIPYSRISNKIKEVYDLAATHKIDENDVNIINTLYETYSSKRERERKEIFKLSEDCYKMVVDNITNWCIPLSEMSDKNNHLDVIFNLTN